MHTIKKSKGDSSKNKQYRRGKNIKNKYKLKESNEFIDNDILKDDWIR